jgi:hypothetical protein
MEIKFDPFEFFFSAFFWSLLVFYIVAFLVSVFLAKEVWFKAYNIVTTTRDRVVFGVLLSQPVFFFLSIFLSAFVSWWWLLLPFPACSFAILARKGHQQ